MRTKRLAPALALAAALTVAGCASPATSTTAATTATTTAAAGTTHLIFYSVNSDGPAFQAILTGEIGDFGPAVSVYPNGQVDPDHNSDLSLRLTRGSFRLSIGGPGLQDRRRVPPLAGQPGHLLGQHGRDRGDSGRDRLGHRRVPGDQRHLQRDRHHR